MDLFERALQYAAEKHAGQLRKMANTPYILHSMEVAAIVGTMTDDREILAAALLHDTVEDTNATLVEIRNLFGERVAALVATETEQKRPEKDPTQTWEVRKCEAITQLLATGDPAVKMLWLGDKLSNMRSIAREYKQKGNAIWTEFHQHDPAKHAWYYRTVATALDSLAGSDAYAEYMRLIESVFGKEE